MPLYIYDPNMIDALGRVEGEPWARSQRTGEGMGADPAKSGHSVQAYVDAWNKLASMRAESGDDVWTDNIDPELFDGPRGDRMIYGEDGYARYTVQHDDEVVLLRWSTWPERIALAEKEGIRVSR